MKIRLSPFNIYLLLFCSMVLLSCRSPEERKHLKEASTLRVFLEAEHGSMDGSAVTIYRQNPIHLSLEREPILSEVDLETASVLDLPGGYGIQAQFNGHAALVLEGATTGHKGRHLAIQSHWDETRWLAAPLITHRISNGNLVFTPDATREECERIVRGLTNVVHIIKKRSFID